MDSLGNPVTHAFTIHYGGKLKIYWEQVDSAGNPFSNAGYIIHPGYGSVQSNRETVYTIGWELVNDENYTIRGRLKEPMIVAAPEKRPEAFFQANTGLYRTASRQQMPCSLTSPEADWRVRWKIPTGWVKEDPPSSGTWVNDVINYPDEDVEWIPRVWDWQILEKDERSSDNYAPFEFKFRGYAGGSGDNITAANNPARYNNDWPNAVNKVSTSAYGPMDMKDVWFTYHMNFDGVIEKYSDN